MLARTVLAAACHGWLQSSAALLPLSEQLAQCSVITAYDSAWPRSLVAHVDSSARCDWPPASTGFAIRAVVRLYAAASTKAQLAKRYRVNNQIRASTLRVLFPDGRHDILSREEALKAAQTHGLDLVEVDGGKDGGPAVAKILDFHKLLYRQQVDEDAHQKRVRQQAKPPKEVHLSSKIQDNDMKRKIQQADGFLQEGHKVSVFVEFKDEEQAERAGAMLEQLVSRLEHATQSAVIDSKAKQRVKGSWLVTIKPRVDRSSSSSSSSSSAQRLQQAPQPPPAAAAVPPAPPPPSAAQAPPPPPAGAASMPAQEL